MPGSLYRTIWRWHFYAGLFVMPFILILSVTGAIYLLKPQLDRWEERAWQGLPADGAVTPDAQVEAALAAFPGARLHSYRLPQEPGDAALVHLALDDRQTMRDVFVSPQGRVLGSLDPNWRIVQVAQRVHGQLLMGKQGSWLVELAASWAIVMILTGLYLWWPRGRGLASVVWPRLRPGGGVVLRDLHAVTGFWVAGLALVLLVTGLPWADVWGSAFKAVRQELGWVGGRQDWTIGGRAADAELAHGDHDHGAMLAQGAAPTAMTHVMPDGSVMHMAMPAVTLSHMVAVADSERLTFPVLVLPPAAGDRGDKAAAVWTVRSDAANRPLRVTITYDPGTGAELSREGFADKHVIDRVVGYGIAWHEGALFGWVNQLIGLATAAILLTLAGSGFLMWRRRRPAAMLGAPPPPREPAKLRGVAAIVLFLAALLPLLAASLVGLILIERLVLARVAPLARWLGLVSARTAAS